VTLWFLWRNLRTRGFENALTLLAVALGVAVALAVPLILGSLREGVIRASNSFDLLITARGSPTQAVLNTLFYQEAPIGNLPYSLYESLERDPRTAKLIPLGFGDNYNGSPMVGTSSQFFQLSKGPGKPPLYGIAQGRVFNTTFEAVIGAAVARQSGLKLGDRFKSAHGVTPTIEEEQHEEEFTVVGILGASGAPGDRAIYIPIEAIWDVHGQTAGGREITAMLLTPTRLGYVYQIASELEKSRVAQGIFPGQTIGRLLDLLGQGRAGYEIIGALALVLALSTVAVNTLAAARNAQRNLAVLRAIGARATQTFWLVLLEAVMVAFGGVLLGIGLAYLIAGIAAGIVAAQTAVTLPLMTLEPRDALRALLVVPVAALFALIPALSAARRSPLERLTR
jgi:putative ABC transport system permease protein